MVQIIDPAANTATEYTLDTETDELDFVRGQYPTGYRLVHEDEDLSAVPKHQIKMKKVEDGEVPQRVPSEYDGLQSGDSVAMFLGGSGDRLAYALTRKGQDIKASVFRIPTFRSKEMRDTADTSQDHVRLAEMYRDQPGRFQLTTPRDLENIQLRELYIQRKDALRARIGIEQLLRSRTIGSIFIKPDGLYPEGSVEDFYDKQKANDTTLANQVAQENARAAELRKLVRTREVWQQVFEPIEGCGEIIAAGIMSGIGDIRRFATADEAAEYNDLDKQARLLEAQAGRNKYRQEPEAVAAPNHFERNIVIRQLMVKAGDMDAADKMQVAIDCRKKMYDLRQRGKGRFKAFCGVHLISGWAECSDCWQTFKVEDNDRDGQLTCPKCSSTKVAKKGMFARRRSSVVANWHPDVRQALYQLGDQFNRRPKSDWGQRLLKGKARYREQYPEKVTKGSKSRYSDGHTHRMATWRTLTRFVEELYETWTWIERKAAKEEPITN